ncbi:hypothetical protein HMPREF1567_2226 [Providencia alcalifaciens PAL-2]|nr:hypothetical protein HMPREF1567_2226 [Providencia alcalifaciens PAL-2]
MLPSLMREPKYTLPQNLKTEVRIKLDGHRVTIARQDKQLGLCLGLGTHPQCWHFC